MKTTKLYLFAFLIIFLTSCASDQKNSASQKTIAKEAILDFQDDIGIERNSIESKRKIIKNVETKFEVTDLKVSSKKLEEITRKYSGYASQMNQSFTNYSIQNYSTVRLPSQDLEVFLTEIEKLSIRTDYSRLTTEDVTESFFDTQNRLKMKKEVRDRYIEILRNKAKTLEEVLHAEEMIRVLQEEIEVAQGRLNRLKDQTSLATVEIQMYQAVVAQAKVSAPSFIIEMKDSFLVGWNILRAGVINLFILWPLLIVGSCFFFYRKYMLTKI